MSVVTIKPRVRKRRAIQFTGSPANRKQIAEFTGGEIIEERFGTMRIALADKTILTTYQKDWVIESNGAGPRFFAQNPETFQKMFKVVEP